MAGDGSFIRSLLPIVAIVAIGIYLHNSSKRQPVDRFKEQEKRKEKENQRRQPNQQELQAAYKRDQKVMEQIFQRGKYVQAEECNAIGECYEITEVPMGARDAKSYTFYRYMNRKGVPDITLTSVVLARLPPGQLKLDTRNMQPNTSYVGNHYIKVMIAGAYFTETLTLGQRGKEGLSIGVGGGMLQTFIRENIFELKMTNVEIDPFMVELAIRWFGYREDSFCQTVVTDGMSFVKQAAEQGKKYDAIFIDACDNASSKKRICPVDDFVDSQNARLISYVIMNLLGLNQQAREEEKKILAAWAPHFKTCYLLPIELNRQLLVCSERPNWSWAEQRKRFLKNIKKLDEKFDFDIWKVMIEAPKT